MWFIDKEYNKLCYSDGQFFTATIDWNYDNDIYTDTVMYIHYLDNSAIRIHEYDMDDFEIVSEEYVRDWLFKELDEYFVKEKNYYCNPTFSGHHYGDYSFFKGGTCVYENENHRQNAIRKEIEYILNKEKSMGK